jgi:uncharacterized C2H2 Zn-finger protein
LTTKKAKLKCPDCTETFTSTSMLGVHRRNVHKVLGMSPAAVSARLRKEQKIAHIKRDAKGNFICPECSYVAVGLQSFAQHRTKVHGKSAYEPIELTALPEPVPVELAETTVASLIQHPHPLDRIQCAMCEATFRLKDTYNKHLKRIHSTTYAELKKQGKTTPRTYTKRSTQLVSQAEAIPVASNGHVQETEARSDAAHPDYITAIAFGRFTEFCSRLADEFDLSKRDLTQRLVGAILQSQVRPTSRGAHRLSSL